MEQYKIGIIGATGMVGQRFALLTANHPWFQPVVLAASSHSAGKTYKDAVGYRWYMNDPMPKSLENIVVMDAEEDAEQIASMVDFVFCAVNMKKRIRISVSDFLRFLTVYHIIWKCSYCLCLVRHRSQSPKRSKNCHFSSLLYLVSYL